MATEEGALINILPSTSMETAARPPIPSTLHAQYHATPDAAKENAFRAVGAKHYPGEGKPAYSQGRHESYHPPSA